MNGKIYTIKVATQGSGLVEETLHVEPQQTHGYRADAPELPGCIKVWVGNETYIVPICNLLMLKMKV